MRSPGRKASSVAACTPFITSGVSFTPSFVRRLASPTPRAVPVTPLAIAPPGISHKGSKTISKAKPVHAEVPSSAPRSLRLSDHVRFSAIPFPAPAATPPTTVRSVSKLLKSPRPSLFTLSPIRSPIPATAYVPVDRKSMMP